MPNSSVVLMADNDYDNDTIMIPDNITARNIADVNLYNGSSNSSVNLTSTNDDDYDFDTTPLPEDPPLDITDTGLINRTDTELYCKENFTFDGNHWAKHCYDDRHCKLYGDCCRDSEFYEESEQTADFGGGGGNVFNNSRYGCYATGSVKHALMIGRCPLGAWTEFDIRDKCENGGDSLATAYPVTGDDTGHTYKNAYCAWCHGERRRVTYWKPVFRCSDVGADGVARSSRVENVSYSMLYRGGRWYYADFDHHTLLRCDFELVPPARGAPPRPCHTAATVDGCPAGTAAAQARKCASYAYTVFEDGPAAEAHAFRNVDCARCNGVPTTRGLRCSPPSPTTMTALSTRFGFNALMKSDPCGPDELYNVGTDRCDSPFRDSIRTGACWTSTAMRPDEYDAQSADNSTVYVYAYKKRLRYQRLNVGARAADAGTLAVCIENAKGPVMREMSAYTAWLEHAGIACSAVSAAALLLHLAMFLLRAKPSNLPEKNLASLAASLLLGYSGYLTATLGAVPAGPNVPCLLAALAIHFGFLAAFAWMFVMSADVWFVLHSSAKKLRVAAGKRNARFAAYSVFAWLVPAAFTAFAAVLQVSDVPVMPELRPNFQRICWFGNPRSQVALFVLPAGAAIAANYVSFVGAVRLVVTSRDHFRSLSGTDATAVTTVSRSRENLRIYVRLSLMMGLAWVFGLVGAVTDNDVVLTLYTALNGLHGLFIFLAFDCDWTTMHTVFAKIPAAISSGSGSDAQTAVTTGTTT